MIQNRIFYSNSVKLHWSHKHGEQLYISFTFLSSFAVWHQISILINYNWPQSLSTRFFLTLSLLSAWLVSVFPLHSVQVSHHPQQWNTWDNKVREGHTKKKCHKCHKILTSLINKENKTKCKRRGRDPHLWLSSYIFWHICHIYHYQHKCTNSTYMQRLLLICTVYKDCIIFSQVWVSYGKTSYREWWSRPVKTD